MTFINYVTITRLHGDWSYTKSSSCLRYHFRSILIFTIHSAQCSKSPLPTNAGTYHSVEVCGCRMCAGEADSSVHSKLVLIFTLGKPICGKLLCIPYACNLTLLISMNAFCHPNRKQDRKGANLSKCSRSFQTCQVSSLVSLSDHLQSFVLDGWVNRSRLSLKFRSN